MNLTRARLWFAVALGVLPAASLVAAQQAPAAASPQQPTPPQAGAPTPPPASGDFKISVGVDAVLVPVVVRDGHGRAVGNLTKDDFQVFDRGKPQKISAFTVERAAAISGTTALAAPTPTVNESAAAATPVIAAPDLAPAPRFTVLLFDDMHLNEGDLMRAQAVGTKLLATPLAPREAAAVVSMSGSNSGITRDVGKLQDAVRQLHVQNLYRHIGRECPDVDYYEADLLMNKHNNSAMETAIANYLTCSNSKGLTPEIARRIVESAASRALNIGEQDTRMSLSFIAEVVRRMGALPGQRTLILVSPGFLTITASALAEKSAIMNMAAQANVRVSALDARGLYTTEIDASERGARSQLALMNGSDANYHRDTADLAGNVMGELADGTGGTFFHNSNDLQGGLQHLVEGPEYLYVLEFSLADAKRDGSYHALSVKVNRSGVNLQARRGYFAPKPAKKKK
jgi:VWFA-related protein